MAVLPLNGGYWLDGMEPTCLSNGTSPSNGERDDVRDDARDANRLEIDETAKCYRKYFLDKVCRWLRC